MIRCRPLKSPGGWTYRNDNWNRLFLRELGRSPNRFYTELRLSQARQDVLAGNNSISNIALDYGFTIPNFSKTYRRVFGALPSQDRDGAQPKRSG